MNSFSYGTIVRGDNFYDRKEEKERKSDNNYFISDPLFFQLYIQNYAQKRNAPKRKKEVQAQTKNIVKLKVKR